MYLEVSSDSDGLDVLFEIFYSDVTFDMSLSLFKPDIPIEVIEWAITVAKDQLPAKRGTG